MITFLLVCTCVYSMYVCVYVCICVLCQRYQPFGHKIFFSLAVSVSLRRLLPEVRAYCKHSELKL